MPATEESGLQELFIAEIEERSARLVAGGGRLCRRALPGAHECRHRGNQAEGQRC